MKLPMVFIEIRCPDCSMQDEVNLIDDKYDTGIFGTHLQTCTNCSTQYMWTLKYAARTIPNIDVPEQI